MKTKNPDRLRLDSERTAAAKYFVRNFSREKRYLIIFARDFSAYLNSAEWLKTAEAKSKQKFYDFLCDFKDLREKMQEFRWSKEFLSENGIDFKSIRKLYFAVAEM